MQFSRWDAQGNVYLLTEQDLTADAVRASVADTDGILQVTGRGEDWAEIVIWNPDGSTAELSGNGTRIAARWLARETGAPVVRIRVGPREVVARMLDGDEVEQDMGEVEVYERERVAGFDVTAVSVGNPHAVVEGDPGDLPLIGGSRAGERCRAEGRCQAVRERHGRRDCGYLERGGMEHQDRRQREGEKGDLAPDCTDAGSRPHAHEIGVPPESLQRRDGFHGARREAKRPTAARIRGK